MADRRIPLTQGQVALVDEADYDRLMRFNWCAIRDAITGTFYAQRTSGPTLSMHRFILGTPSNLHTDHRNGNGLDNRRSNLRICTHSQNQQNANKQRRDTTSKFKGVTWSASERTWRARIKLQGKLHYIGRFRDETEAARAYDRKARELFGEFARPNFPMEAST